MNVHIQVLMAIWQLWMTVFGVIVLIVIGRTNRIWEEIDQRLETHSSLVDCPCEARRGSPGKQPPLTSQATIRSRSYHLLTSEIWIAWSAFSDSIQLFLQHRHAISADMCMMCIVPHCICCTCLAIGGWIEWLVKSRIAQCPIQAYEMSECDQYDISLLYRRWSAI
jgi:hypothetical protein